MDRGEGSAADPGYYYTPLIVGPTPQSADFTQRLTWSTMAMSFFDPTVVVLSYTGLSPTLAYVAEVVFNAEREPAAVRGGRHHRRTRRAAGDAANGSDAGDGDGSPHEIGRSRTWGYGDFQLLANGNVQVWPLPPLQYSLPPSPMQVTGITIPSAATSSGNLTLSCRPAPGLVGNGRTCQITEVWLKPVQVHRNLARTLPAQPWQSPDSSLEKSS